MQQFLLIFKGLLNCNKSNYNNTEKSVFGSLRAIETDRLSNYGYKTNKTGFELGTKFEYLRDFQLGVSSSSYYEKIRTDSSASARQKSQEGDYWDTFANLEFNYDKEIKSLEQVMVLFLIIILKFHL